MNMEKYYGHGKLLLSGEYFILKGAKGLSIPLRVGQSMEVESVNDNHKQIIWQVKDVNGHWFHAVLDRRKLTILESDNRDMANNLTQILKKAKQLNPKKFRDPFSYQVQCDLQFDRNWGMGSSSTLLSNVGYWLQVDAMKLHFAVSKGSGYDVATAQINLPIVYHLYKRKYPVVRAVHFNPSFTDQLFFVYQGEKVNSSRAVYGFNLTNKELQEKVPVISDITERMVVCNNIEEFMKLMREHEKAISGSLKMEPVLDHYTDFKGAIKSLGAWGGDFMLVATTENEKYVKDYFTSKGLQTIYPYHQLALYDHEF